jgi:hypothetical protein
MPAGDDESVPTDGGLPVTPVVRALFLKMLEEREKKGIETYGRSLHTDNGRDPIQDALEEVIDAFQYLVQARMEASELQSENNTIRRKAKVLDSILDAYHAGDMALAMNHFIEATYEFAPDDKQSTSNEDVLRALSIYQAALRDRFGEKYAFYRTNDKERLRSEKGVNNALSNLNEVVDKWSWGAHWRKKS